MSLLLSQSTPPSAFLLCAHVTILYLCVSTSALQTGSSVPFFPIFYIYTLICGICCSLYDLLHSVRKTLGPFTSLKMTQFHSFLWLRHSPLYIAPCVWTHLSSFCSLSFILCCSPMPHTVQAHSTQDRGVPDKPTHCVQSPWHH